ncbi:MAG: GTP-binding protein [Promethearchaeota archaeon]|nr:MAG: GTP-binding protein [Candidatus Lokiarchaeota archaeon]
MSEEPNYIVKICLLGEAAVGKTSLVYRFIENKFRDNYKSTLGVNLLKKDLNVDNYGKVSAQIWDLGGQESFKSLRKLYLEGSNGALLIFDTTNRKSFDKLNDWISSFRESRGNRPLLLIGNKIDLEDKKKVEDAEANELASINDMNFISTSAKTGANVEIAFKDLIKTILDDITKDS